MKNTKNKYPDSPMLVFLDLDGIGKQRIDEFLNKVKDRGLEDYIARDEIFFVNPCIEYLYAVGKENKHPHVSSDKYKSMMNRLYGLENYDATAEQVEKIVCELKDDGFQNLLSNIPNISSDSNHLPSSDIVRLIGFIQKLKDDD